MSKHTPGPWEIDSKHPEYVQQVGREDVGICSVLNIDEDEDEEGSADWFRGPVTEANARLIAAAPELLAALEGMMSDMRLRARMRDDIDADGTVVLDCGTGVLMAVDAAIAKAKGGAA